MEKELTSFLKRKNALTAMADTDDVTKFDSRDIVRFLGAKSLVKKRNPVLEFCEAVSAMRHPKSDVAQWRRISEFLRMLGVSLKMAESHDLPTLYTQMMEGYPMLEVAGIFRQSYRELSKKQISDTIDYINEVDKCRISP